MRNKEQKNTWKDIQDIWNNQPQSEKINIQVSELVAEFKAKVSPFEKKLINKDIAFIKANTSEFEKKSIGKDIDVITSFIKKLINKFKINK